MRQLFLLARRMGEFLGHRFDHSRDLTLVPSARTDPTEKDASPPAEACARNASLLVQG
jgi:hypothetical protein